MSTAKSKPAPTRKPTIAERMTAERGELLDETYRLLYREAAGVEVSAEALSGAISALGWDHLELKKHRQQAAKGCSAASHFESHDAFAEAQQARDDARLAVSEQEPKLREKIRQLESQIAGLHRDVGDAERDVATRTEALKHLRLAAPEHIVRAKRMHDSEHIQPLRERRTQMLNDGGGTLLTMPKLNPHDPAHQHPIMQMRDTRGEQPWVQRSERGRVINAEQWRRFLSEENIAERAAALQAELDDLDAQIKAAEAEAETKLDYWLAVHAAESAA